MTIWILETEEYDYDDYNGFVVIAESEADARRVAQQQIGAERTYQDISTWACEPVVDNGVPRVVLASYNAG